MQLGFEGVALVRRQLLDGQLHLVNLIVQLLIELGH